MSDSIQQFRDALIAHGIVPPANILADGQLHRCDADGLNGKGDASYLLHSDGIPAGGFQNWRDGQGWQLWRANIGRRLSKAERNLHKRRVDDAKRKNEIENADRNRKARVNAVKQLTRACPAVDHPYLVAKAIEAHGVYRDEDSLLIPVHDATGELHSLQFIDTSGAKRFLSGGRVIGCFFLIGEPKDVLCIVEGFATGASLHQATGYAVAVAFHAGNLLSVSKALREKYPNTQLVLCADDDYLTAGNPGLARATEAAEAVGGLLAVPDFGPDRPEGTTDFNDLHLLRGLDAVSNGVTETLCKPTKEVKSCVAQWPYDSGHFRLSPEGVLFVDADKDGNSRPPLWICSPLIVLAKTRSIKNDSWGRLLEWHDSDGVVHRWAMPAELLQGDGLEVRRELARSGLSIEHKKPARDLLPAYVQFFPVEARARCVERLGWHGTVYVTSNRSIGQSDEIIVFQNTHALEPALSTSGTAEEWRNSVGALAVGNSRLIFGLSAAFAGPIMDLVKEDSGGFHFRGGSSTGKTTILKVAASVWGNPSTYPRAWRATVNGLEGLAAMHSDGVLILDELSQMDPQEAGDAAYLLANGRGKARASKTGAARTSAHWRLIFLSAGEESLPNLMMRAGKSVNVGQEIRLADIGSDAGAGYGAFEELHDHVGSAAFALAVTEAAANCHGAIGLEWLGCVVNDRLMLAGKIKNGIEDFVGNTVPSNAAGQVCRVARRFALVGMAGELATECGLTGWRKGDAIWAAKTCFATWLESFGGVSDREDRAALARVRTFFETHAGTRFEDPWRYPSKTVQNCAGFCRVFADGTRKFMVLPGVFEREICSGVDSKRVREVLLRAGWLERGEDNRQAKKMRIAKHGPRRVYVFNELMWKREDGD